MNRQGGIAFCQRRGAISAYNRTNQFVQNDTSCAAAQDDRQCIVCSMFSAHFFAWVDGARYERCGTCGATFLNPAQRLSSEAESAQYRLHQNDPDDDGYRRFLSKLADPLLQRLPLRAKGLDFNNPFASECTNGTRNQQSLVAPISHLL